MIVPAPTYQDHQFPYQPFHRLCLSTHLFSRRGGFLGIGGVLWVTLSISATAVLTCVDPLGLLLDGRGDLADQLADLPDNLRRFS